MKKYRSIYVTFTNRLNEGDQGRFVVFVRNVEAKTIVKDLPNKMKASRRAREADAWNIVGVLGHREFQKDSWRASGLAVELMTDLTSEEVNTEWIEVAEGTVTSIHEVISKEPRDWVVLSTRFWQSQCLTISLLPIRPDFRTTSFELSRALINIIIYQTKPF